jgi:hypothetical protein
MRDLLEELQIDRTGATVRAGTGPARRTGVVTRVEVQMSPHTVIFACVHNAGRSQMAAALFNELADPAKAHALSPVVRAC